MGKGSEWTCLSKRQMANKHIEKIFNITSHQGLQIKTMVINHFIPNEIAIIKSQIRRSISKEVDKSIRTLTRCLWKYKMVQPLWKTVRQCFKKLSTEFTFDSAIPFLGINPIEMKMCPHKSLYTNLHTSIAQISQKRK